MESGCTQGRSHYAAACSRSIAIGGIRSYQRSARCRRAMAGHGYSPREIYDHNGNAHNVTLEPGYMLLFESHSAIHGHPFPLKGRYVALIFIHFEPTGGHTFEKNESGYYYLRQEDEHSNKTVSKKKSLKDINKEYHENSIAGMVDNRRQ